MIGKTLSTRALIALPVCGLWAASVASLVAPATWLSELVTSVAPQLALAATLMALVFFARREQRLFAAAAMLAALQVWRFEASAPVAEAGPEGKADLVVVWANVLHQRDAVGQVFALAREEGATLVAFAEFPHGLKADTIDLLARDFPYRAGEAAGGPGVVSLFSREPLRVVASPGAGGRFAIVAALDDAGPSGMLIGAGHPKSPISPSRLAERDAYVGALAAALDEADAALLIGDLNMAPWSPAFRRLSTTHGLRRLDIGRAPTWLAPVPGIGLPIDHALVGGFVTGTARVGPFIGSDHYPLIVRIDRTARR